MSIHFSSKNCDWETPQWLFDKLNKNFSFNIDICADAKNKKCKRFCKNIFKFKPKKTDVCFMNPPYGRSINKFVLRAWELSKTATVVCLLPARTDTRWWSIFWDREQQTAKTGCQVIFLEGRLKFGNAQNSAPFPSVIVIMNRHLYKNEE